jgi:PadR family transcriptional regulator PadR
MLVILLTRLMVIALRKEVKFREQNFRIPRTYKRLPYKRLFNMTPYPPDPEWKKGSAELLVLSLLEDQPRHGYDISKLIQVRSAGALRFHVTSLYPLLHRLEEQGSIAGRWVERAEQRRRRYYSLTGPGRELLRSKQQSWKDFVAVINRVTGGEHA